jgi:hypothetical protein
MTSLLGKDGRCWSSATRAQLEEEAAWHRGGLKWCDAIAPQQTPVSTGVGKTSDGVEALGRTKLRRTMSGGGGAIGMGLVRVADWLPGAIRRARRKAWPIRGEVWSTL